MSAAVAVMLCAMLAYYTGAPRAPVLKTWVVDMFAGADGRKESFNDDLAARAIRRFATPSISRRLVHDRCQDALKSAKQEDLE